MKRPDLIEQIDELVSMGGSFKAMETVRRLQNIITGATLMELQCAMRLLQKQAKKST